MFLHLFCCHYIAQGYIHITNIVIYNGLMLKQGIQISYQHHRENYYTLNNHFDDIYVKCNLSNITVINIYQTGCFIFKAVNGLVPRHWSNLFITNRLVTFVIITRDSILIVSTTELILAIDLRLLNYFLVTIWNLFETVWNM